MRPPPIRSGSTTGGDETMGVEGVSMCRISRAPKSTVDQFDRCQTLATQDASIVRKRLGSILVFPRLPILPGLFPLSPKIPVIPAIPAPKQSNHIWFEKTISVQNAVTLGRHSLIEVPRITGLSVFQGQICSPNRPVEPSATHNSRAQSTTTSKLGTLKSKGFFRQLGTLLC